jgi:hypothetical protein
MVTPVPVSVTGIVIVNVFAVAVITSNELVSKLAVVKLVVVGPGVVTLVNLTKSPTTKLCAFLLIVTVLDPVVDV